MSSHLNSARQTNAELRRIAPLRMPFPMPRFRRCRCRTSFLRRHQWNAPKPISVLPPGLTRISLTASDKFHIYIHKTFGPPAVILPTLGAGLQWANPPSRYPREWKDGAGAFGRNYGYRVADHTARNTAEFLTDVLLHEDPRYQRSTSTNPFARTFHALSFTV